MNIASNFLRSLLLTIVLAFSVPILLLGGLLVGVCAIGYLPVIGAIGHAGTGGMLQFLAAFGNGCPLEGAIVISMACSFVGALFDTYAFYYSQNLGRN